MQGINQTLKEDQIWAQLWQKGERLGWYTRPPDNDSPEAYAKLAQMSEEDVQIYAKEIYLNRGYNSIEFQREHKARLEAIRNQIGVCCFAGRGNDYLMFAHYGDQHRGCCLEFQIRDENGERQSIFKDGFILNDVVYDDEPPTVPIFHPLTALLKIIMTKHSRWSYEEEIRFVRASGSGPAIYRRETLSGIIFGYRTSDNDIAKVLGWLGQRNNINLFRAVPNQLSSLDLVPLEI